jgi:Ca2+-binding RTX toxin-like protein
MKSNTPNNRSKLAGAALAALGSLGLSGKASAQQADNLVAADAIDGVAQVRQLPDGSVEIVMDDGQVLKLDASQVTVENGQVFVDAAIAEGLAADASSFIADNALLLGAAAVVAAGVGIGVGVSGGGGDDPTDMADILVGTAEADAIAGLAGDDQISGLAGNDTLDGGAGNDTLDGGTGADTLIGGTGADTLIGGAGDDTIVSDALDTVDGGAGTDTLDLSSAAPGVVIDLDTNTPQPGPASQDGAILDAPGGEVVVEIDDIENVIGTSGDDLILANNEINVIDAGAGDDTVHTFGGADTVDGGAGTDTILFSAGGGVTIDLDEMGGATATIGEMESDTISNFENVNGSAMGDDNISGNSGVNVLNGQGGDDILNGEGGADTLIGGEGDDTIISDGLDTIDGGEGIDTVDFSAVEENTTGGAFSGVIVDLDVNSAGPNGTPSQDGAVLTAPPAAGGEPIVDVDDVENVIGSDFNDGLFGNNEINVLDGGAGNDIVHGFAGDDFLQGGEGTDTVLFSAAPAGVEVDLNQQVSAEEFDAAVEAGEGQIAAVGGAGNNVLSGFENVTGSQSDDDITGDANDNVLNGNGGDDVLTGGLGNDTLIGGLGNDTLSGGEGFDTADFSDLDVPVQIVVDAEGDGTATRDTGFSVEVVDAVVDGSAFGADLTPQTFVSEAVAGNIYFNIHTSEFPSGEIRGQLGVVSDVTDADGVRTIVLEGGLDASQEPGPPVGTASDSEATGFATVTITVAADGTVTYSSTLDVEGIAPSELISLGAVSAIHLHNAPAGLNGDVVQDFIVDAGNAGPALPFTVVDPVTETDTLDSIEEFILSDDNDSFISNGAGAQTVFGGEGDDLIAGGGGIDILDGGEGNDTNSFENIGFDVVASLADGTASYGPVNETFTNFENLTGSANNDMLTGDENDNILDGGAGTGSDTLIGGDGDDILIGRGGTDFIDGGAGIDTNSFEGIGLGVTATVDADGDGTAVYGQVNESFTGIENLTGTDNDDTLTATGAASNTLIGGAGDDFISGGGGSDITDGGAGNDTVSFADIGPAVTVSVDENGDGTAVYVVPSGTEIVDTLTSFENFVAREGDGDVLDLSAFSEGVRVDLDTNTPQLGPNSQNGVVQTFDDAGDPVGLFTVTDFENIVGTDFDDVLLGNNETNIIEGGGGNDAIHTFGGADTADGGEGIDTVLLTATPVGTTLDLDEDGNGTVIINGEASDMVLNFENITGSATGDDTLSGNSGVNVLNGNGGDDTLTGEGGDDTINGGEGNDTAIFNDLAANIDVTENDDGTLTVVSADGTDTLTSIETILDSEGTVVFTTLTAPAATGSNNTSVVDAGSANASSTFAQDDALALADAAAAAAISDLNEIG